MEIKIHAVHLLVLISGSLTAIINGSLCTGKPNDVIFLVDTSRSIWRPHFEAQLRFVLDVIKRFQVGSGENETRIAVATYAQRPWPQFNLRDFYRMQDVNISIMAIQHMGGYRTNTGAALEFGIHRMLQPTFGARQNSTKAIVLLTDGQSQDNTKAIEVASKAKEEGIIIIVIAVGRAISLKTLDEIASSPTRDHLFVREDFMSLNGVSIEVARKICKSTVTTTAPTTTLASTTLTVTQRRLQTPQTEKVIGSKVIITTRQTTASGESSSQMIRGEQAPVASLPTGVDLGLNGKITTTSTTSRYISQSGQEQDGRVSAGPGTGSKTVNDRTIALGSFEGGSYPPIRNGVSQTEAPSWRVGVDWSLPGLLNRSREPSDIDPSLIVSNCGGKPADIYFVLDASNSIWPEDFKKQLSFVRDLINIFDISEDKTRVGVVTFSDYVNPEITLESRQEKAALVERVSNITFLMGRTDTALALRFVREQGFSPDVARREVAHIMLVFTDGLSKNPRHTADEAALARKAGIYLFAIGIGESVEREELRDIASDPDDDFVFQVSDFGALNTIKNILAIKTCAIQADATLEDVKGCSIKRPTDLMFVYDSSELGTKKTKLITEFVDYVTKALDMNTGNLRAGRLTENCLSRADVWLTSDQRSLSHERVKFPEFRELIRKLVTSGFQRRNGARINSKKIAVLFLDDDLSTMREAAEEIKRLRDADTFVITIGDVDPVISQRFSSVPMDDYIVHIPSYRYLNTARSTAVHKLCKILNAE